VNFYSSFDHGFIRIEQYIDSIDSIVQALAGGLVGFVLASFGLWLVLVYSAPFAVQ
jgi:hypothetical protein